VTTEKPTVARYKGPAYPVRTFRAGQEYDDAAQLAQERGDNISDVLRQALRDYIKTHSKEEP
jgi:hypothetical protein